MTQQPDSKRQTLAIVGLIALIIALFIGVKGIFRMLETILVVQQPPTQSEPADPEPSAPAPGFCLFCGEELPEGVQWGMYCPYCGEKLELEAP